MPEPGVDQPPWGRFLPRDAVVVIVLSHLLILPPGQLLRAQGPAVRMGWLRTPYPARAPPHTCRDRGSQSDPQPGDVPGTGGAGPRRDPPPPYLSGGATTLGGLCRYCLKRSSKACPTVLMTLCASPSQHSRMWQAADRQTDSLNVSPTLSPPLQDCPEPPLMPPREISSSSLHPPAHPSSSTQLPSARASITSLVDGVLGDIGDVVGGVLGAQGMLRAHVLLLCGEQGQGCRGKGTGSAPAPHPALGPSCPTVWFSHGTGGPCPRGPCPCRSQGTTAGQGWGASVSPCPRPRQRRWIACGGWR